jgi:hypothetical protein
VRAYVKNNIGVFYSNEVIITTITPQKAVLTTIPVGTITINSGLSGGVISSDGNAPITQRGICYSTSTGPTITNSFTTNGIGTGTYTSTISGLAAGTTYYVKAYAINLAGTSYGDEVKFTTLAITKPTLNTASVSSISTNSATSGGTIVTDGNATITQSGVCYSTSANPTIANFQTIDGSATGTYVSRLTGLKPGTTYYVKAYATNSAGTGYGPETSFTTVAINKPTLTTTSVSSITYNSATSGGTILTDGNATITQSGVCYSTSANPTIANFQTIDGSASGSFTSRLTQLNQGTTYYVKAYATNATGTYYGAEVKFAYVLAPTMAALPTPTVTTNGANVTATITADGGGDITSYGFVWGTSVNPTTSASSVTIANNTNGIYTNIPLSYSITGITRNITYYVRSFAINSAGISYGQQTSFVLPGTSAIVTTSDATGLTATSVTIGGNVTDEGGSPVTAKGIVYSTLSGPTTALTTKSSNGTGLGAFTTSISGLTRSITYYYRAYAKNATSIVYGEQKLFITKGIPAGLIVYDIPATRGTEIHYSLSGIKPGHYALRIFNSVGQLVYQKDMSIQVDFIDDRFIFPAKLPIGNYTLEVFNPFFKIHKAILIQ